MFQVIVISIIAFQSTFGFMTTMVPFGSEGPITTPRFATSRIMNPSAANNFFTTASTTTAPFPPTTRIVNPSAATNFFTTAGTTTAQFPPTTRIVNPSAATNFFTTAGTTTAPFPPTTRIVNPSAATNFFTTAGTTPAPFPPTTRIVNPSAATNFFTTAGTTTAPFPPTTRIVNPSAATNFFTTAGTTTATFPPTTRIVNPSAATNFFTTAGTTTTTTTTTTTPGTITTIPTRDSTTTRIMNPSAATNFFTTESTTNALYQTNTNMNPSAATNFFTTVGTTSLPYQTNTNMNPSAATNIVTTPSTTPYVTIMAQGTTTTLPRTTTRIMTTSAAMNLLTTLSTTQVSLTTTLQQTTAAEEISLVTMSDVKALYSSLLGDYDTRLRPLLNQDKIIRVYTTFVPLKVMDFDTQEQKIDIIGYFQVQWKDQMLRWKPDDFAGKNSTLIPVKNIWTPPLLIAKAYDGNNIIGDQSTDQAHVSHTGTVKWLPEDIYSIVCEVNIKYYPFDGQTCYMTYFLKDESMKTAKLVFSGRNILTTFVQNPEWELISYTTERRTKDNNSLIDLRFDLKRRAGFTIFTVVAPLFMLSFLNGMVFLVPIESGEKGSFAITIFLAYGIFVTIINDTLPHNSLHVPYFLYYITSLLSLSVVLVFYTILQSKLLGVIGQKTFKLQIPTFISNLTSSPKKEVNDETKSVSDTDVNDETGHYLWSGLIKGLDNVLFPMFCLLITLATGLFLGVVDNQEE